VEEAVDCFDDDAPLRQSGDSAQSIEASLHFDGDPNAQLRVILDLFPFTGASWRTAGAAPYSIVGHDCERWRRTAEMRELRCVSNACDVCVNTSDNVMRTVFARRDPTRTTTTRTNIEGDGNSLTNAQFGRATVSSATRNVADQDAHHLGHAWERLTVLCTINGVCVACSGDVPETSTPTTERRTNDRIDRRKQSRSGRRTTDPHMNWRRIAWLFGAYAICLSVRALPSTVWKFFKNESTPTAG